MKFKNYILPEIILIVEQDSSSDQQIREILSLNKVAVVGMSKNSSKAAHYVPKYLVDNGYDVTPVNPTANEILGKKCYSSISEIDEEIDIIDIFRPSDQVLPFVQEAIKKNLKLFGFKKESIILKLKHWQHKLASK